MELGLLDRFHGTTLFHRFCDRSRSRVTDVVVGETARIAMNTHKRKVQGIVSDQKRGCAHRGGKGKEKNSRDGNVNVWLTRSLPRFC